MPSSTPTPTPPSSSPPLRAEARAATADVVRQLRALSPEIEAAILLSPEGQVHAFDAAPALGGALSPIVSALSHVAARASREAGRGEVEQVVVRAPGGLIVVQDLGDGWCLGILSEQDGRLGLLLEDVRSAAVFLRGHLHATA